jgi:hypothetical protein
MQIGHNVSDLVDCTEITHYHLGGNGANFESRLWAVSPRKPVILQR